MNKNDLRQTVGLGRFLLECYEHDGEINTVAFLADFLRVCKRFGDDFNAVLESAQETLHELTDAEPGPDEKYYTVGITHDVQFHDCIGVYAKTAGEAEKKAKTMFYPKWSQSSPPEVTVVEVEEDQE